MEVVACIQSNTRFMGMPLPGETGVSEFARYSSIFPVILSRVATRFFFFLPTQTSKASMASKASKMLLDRIPERTKNKLDNFKFRLVGRANSLKYLAWQAG